jgi:hypothetical protein
VPIVLQKLSVCLARIAIELFDGAVDAAQT